MARKKIDVGSGYALCFVQRAAGEETPYYVGLIYKDGIEIGRFENGGRGGCTTVQPYSVAKAFGAMVTEAAGRLGHSRAITEPEGLVVMFAEMKGYARGCATVTLDAVVSAMLAEMASFDAAHAAPFEPEAPR